MEVIEVQQWGMGMSKSLAVKAKDCAFRWLNSLSEQEAIVVGCF
jgi:hypothetical protein